MSRIISENTIHSDNISHKQSLENSINRLEKLIKNMEMGIYHEKPPAWVDVSIIKKEYQNTLERLQAEYWELYSMNESKFYLIQAYNDPDNREEMRLFMFVKGEEAERAYNQIKTDGHHNYVIAEEISEEQYNNFNDMIESCKDKMVPIEESIFKDRLN